MIQRLIKRLLIIFQKVLRLRVFSMVLRSLHIRKSWPFNSVFNSQTFHSLSLGTFLCNLFIDRFNIFEVLIVGKSFALDVRRLIIRVLNTFTNLSGFPWSVHIVGSFVLGGNIYPHIVGRTILHASILLLPV